MTDIPILSTLPSVTITATANQTNFGYPFVVLSSDQLKVSRLPAGQASAVDLVETTDYTVTGVGNENGGSIDLTPGSFPTGATEGDRLTLFRQIPIERLTDFRFRGRFDARVANKEFDTIYLVAQELSRDLGRTIGLQPADALDSINLPLDTERAGRFLAFDAGGLAIAAAGTSADLTPVSAFINDELFDDVDAATARATLGALAVLSGMTANRLLRVNPSDTSQPQQVPGIIIEDDANDADIGIASGHGNKVEEVAATTYTIIGADAGKTKVFTAATAVTITLPENATEDIARGFGCLCVQAGAGDLTFQAQGAETILSLDSSLTSLGQGAAIGVQRVEIASGPEWLATGGLL
ncbi:hypothetical protein HBA54_03140 [Pelagibius litoralis]|uniref:Uncharacterized protein n=1 Tax=Pelagibius litoralis TaxID=374515 RepID=A0A967EUV0_9PROT|nr:hypothetical protein [Pelagibius litoralis]NIA67577.1 hypothetical protein [Pelagibius litoralis]